jgi:hypothetical protein
MPSWKKILQSGSAIHVLNITASGLPNTAQANIVGYNSQSGIFTYFSTSSLVSGGSVIGGSGTQNYITRWSGNTTITTSSIYESDQVGFHGNIGIGTIDPRQKLHVSGGHVRISNNGEAYLEIITTGSNNNAYIDLVNTGEYSDYGLRLIREPTGGSYLYHRGIGDFGLHATESANIVFYTTATERMRITSGGNVGIGTTSPTAKLQVLDSFTVSASSGQFADVKFRLLTQSYKNHVLTYDETTGQIYYFSSSLEATVPTCNPPIPAIGATNYDVCSGSATTLSALNVNPLQPIGTLTYQWSANGTPILNATQSQYYPIITANTTFTVTMCDGVCCNTADVNISVKPHNTITLSSAAGTDNQTVSVLASITPIVYTTSGASGATVIGLPSGVSGSWTAGTFTIGGVPTAAGPFNYTVTMTDGCTGGVNDAVGNITVTGQSGQFQIRGVVRYDNTALTPLSGVEVRLLDSNAVYNTNINAITDISGAYTMSFTVTGGNYLITAISTKYWAGVNATDSLAINRHFSGVYPLTALRLKAADVNGNGAVNAGDALLNNRRYANIISNFSTVGDWVSETTTINISTGIPTYTRNIKMLSTGDVNGSRPGSSL